MNTDLESRSRVYARGLILVRMPKKKLNRFLVLLLVASSLLAGAKPNTAHNPQRDRRATSSPAPSPTATPTPSLAATPSAKPAESPQVPPAPTPTQPRTANTTKTLAELQARIAEILRKPDLASAMVAVKVASLDTGRVLYEENANKLLRPASNMKLYTVAAALDRLSPDFRFTTSVYAGAKPDAAGVIHGDLKIYGRGDPSIAARFNNGDYFKGIGDLAAKIASTGIKRVEGDLVGDESYFTGPQYGSGWTWEDLTWWYGAEVSALTINDNALDLFVRPGAQVGAPARVTTGPPDPLLTIVNRVTTGPKASRRELTVHRGLAANTLEVSGSIAVDDERGYTGGVGISHPALLFVSMLRSALAQRGVTVTGKTRTVGQTNQALLTAGATVSSATLGNGNSGKATSAIELISLQSPPLSVVAAQTLKPSQNLYTELILRTLGIAVPPASSSSVSSSEDAGLDVVRTFLKEAGLNPTALALTDGSGLSRNDMVTAEATLQLLSYMSQHKYANVFRDALPIAGVDGTLRNRMKGTVAENNVHAKTGSLSSAASLSGYVTTAAGERLVFSIMVNNFPEGVEPRQICIDPIAVLLASFAGQP